jgi:FMN phosphatase YigB (HAD superfamily)
LSVALPAEGEYQTHFGDRQSSDHGASRFGVKAVWR